MCPVKAKRAGSEPPPRLFGVHVSIAGGVHNALHAAHALRCPTAQVFVKNQRQWRAPPLNPEHVAEWHTLRLRHGFGPLVAHATYLINLAAADPVLHARSAAALADELERCATLAIPYLVVHPGAATSGTRTAAVQRVAQAVDAIYAAAPRLPVQLLLEVTAGQGSALGSTFEELAAIIGQLAQPDHVGICIDTCHVFAAGYDIRTPAGYADMLASVARTVGVERVRCWHLNDSRTALGSRVDRHEHIGAGQLGLAAFRQVVRDPRFRAVPMLLETPKGTDPAGRDYDRVNLRRLRSLAARA